LILDNYLALYKVSSTDNRLDRKNYSRFVTTFLIHCIAKGYYNDALVTTMSQKEPWKAESIITNSSQEIIRAAGSKYTYVPQKQHYTKLNSKSMVVALPCQIDESSKDFLTIGLFCGLNSGPEKLKYICKKKKFNLEDVKFFNYRDTNTNKMKFVLKNDREILIKQRGLNYAFAMPMCKSCKDFSAINADIAVGDYDFAGSSVVVIRTKRALEVFEKCVMDGSIKAEKIGISDLLQHRTSGLILKELGKTYEGNPFISIKGKIKYIIPIKLYNLMGGMLAVYYKYIKSSIIYFIYKLKPSKNSFE